MPESTWVPPDYEPFPKMLLCGNTLINVRVPISYLGEPAFLIGRGKEERGVEKPLIWLNMFTDTGTRPLIRAGQRLHADVSITEIQRGFWHIVVMPKDVLVVRLYGEDGINIPMLDMRPLGLSIFGDTMGLNVGGKHLYENVFKDVERMIAIKGKEFPPNGISVARRHVEKP
jgi:hypothetical protein